jgi:broad specificity phosphatase PhoE
MKAFFMRHGQTNYNVKNLCNDNPSKDVHLTNLGKEQTKKAAELFKDKNLDIIFISEFPRTKETADIINKFHNKTIIVDGRINDRKTGGFDGRPSSEFLESIKEDMFNIKPVSGESFQDEKKRVVSFLEDLKKTEYNAILVIAHQDTIQIVSGHFNGLSDKEMYDLKVDNCKIVEFNI